MPQPRASTNVTGASLAEMVISLTLMGMVMIPVVLVSSAWFSNQLLQTREGLSVHHHASQWLNRLVYELSQTAVLMPNSGDHQVEFAYFDTTRQQTRKRRYQLVPFDSSEGAVPAAPKIPLDPEDTETLAGDETAEAGPPPLYLEEQDFNERTHQWDSTSPYGIGLASAILLEPSARFYFCTETQCGVPPNRATLIKLMGWEFYKAKTPQASRLKLPDVRLYLADSASGTVRVGTKPSQSFAFAIPKSPRQSFAWLNTHYHAFATLAAQGSVVPFAQSGSPTHQAIGVQIRDAQGITVYNSGVQPTRQTLMLNNQAHSQIEAYQWVPAQQSYISASSLGYSNWLPAVDDLAVDPADNLLVLLNTQLQQLLMVSPAMWQKPKTIPARIDLPMAQRPTAVCFNERTGDILILDSERKAGGQLTMFVMSRSGRMKKALPIPIGGFRPLTLDDAFDMTYDPIQNSLLLVGKESGRGYGVILPERL